MEKKKLTKSDVTVSDAVYIIFTIVIAFCFIACAVVSLFIIASGCVWLVKSFQVESGYVFKSLCLTFLMLLSSALFVYLDIVIFKTVKNSLTTYLKERKEILSELDKEQETPTQQE